MAHPDPPRAGRQGLLLAPLMGFLGNLRFPWLFALAALVFGVDLVIPDLIPLADEVLFGLVTLMLGSVKKRRDGRRGVRVDQTPRLDDSGSRECPGQSTR